MGTKTYNNYEDLLTFTRASKGHALRPVSYGTELVTNGGFDTDSDWTKLGGSTISSGEGHIVSTGSFVSLNQDIGAVTGKIYFVTIDVTVNSGAGVYIGIGGGAIDSRRYDATFTGTHSFALVAGNVDTNVQITRAGPTDSDVNNVSVKEVTFDQPDGTLTLFEHPNNIPRVEWDAQRNRLGLLVEESRTNLITHSQDFTNAAWTKTNTATLALDSVGPDGQANSAVNLVDSGATGTGVVFLFDTVTVETSSTYTASVYAKKNGLSDILLYHGNFTTPSDGGYYFNLEDGTITAGGSSGTATIEEVGNGWYRCAITFTTDAADTSGAIRMYVTDGTNITVDLDGTSSVLIYGAQLEKGSFPTSYIKNEGTSGGVTRSADVASIPVADFGFNADAGSLLVSYDTKGSNGTSYPRPAEINDGTSSNRIAFWINPSNNVGLSVSDGGVNQGTVYNGGTLSTDTAIKSAGAYKLNDLAHSTNGTTAGTDTSATIPTVTTLRIGSQTSAQELNGHIKSIQYYPRRLTNAQLQDITS